MDYGVLHLNLISANDLNNANMFSKMDVYAVVFAKAPPSTRAPARTPAVIIFVDMNINNVEPIVTLGILTDSRYTKPR